MGTGRLSTTTHSRLDWKKKARHRGPALLAIALLAAALSACGTSTASLPASLPAVSGGVIQILTVQLADGIVGRPYNNAVETSGAFVPLTACTVTGTLPPGLSVSPSGATCRIQGTPTGTGTFNFTVAISDSSLIPQTARVDLSITVRPEFTITAFQVVDAVAGRAYNNSFQVTTNLQNNPVATEVGSGEAGNGPAASCQVGGLPGNMSATCTPNTSGVMDVTLTSTGPLAAGGPFNLTLSVTDQDIIQADSGGNPHVVVGAATLDNSTTAAPFAVTFTVRAEFQVLSPVPLDATDAITGRTYMRTFVFTTDLADNGDDIPNDVNSGEAGNGPLNSCAVLGLPADFNGSCVVDPGGLTGTVQITSAGVTTLPSTLPLTLELTDADIPQGGVPAVLAATQSLPFTLTVRGEYSITDTGLPGGGTTLPTAVQGQLYDFSFTVVTDTVAGANDIGQAAELGNGAIVNCTVTGLPAGLAFNLISTAANGCTLQVTGTPIATGTTTTIVVDVTDTPIPDTTVDVVPANTLQQTNVDITVALPLTFTLRTDPVGGTFNDATSGGVAPDAALNRTYGNGGTGLRDLLFEVTGGIAPYSWLVTGPAPTPIGCAQEGTNNEFFRCNSGGAGVTGATSALAVQVTDTGSGGVGVQMVSTDVDGHASHTINVRAALALTPNAVGNAPPTGVQQRTYGDAGSTCPGPVACSPLTYTGSGGLLPYVFTTPGSVAAPAGNGVPAAVACTAGATVTTCTSGASTVTAAVGNYPFTVQVDDTANDTTPSAAAQQARSIDIVPELEFGLFRATGPSGPFTPTDPIFPGVQDRNYIAFESSNNALVLIITAGTGLPASYGWDTAPANLPGDLECALFTTGTAPNDELACFAQAVSGGAFVPQPAAGTFNIVFEARDGGNAAVPAGAVTTDDQGHTSHDIIINDPLALAISVGDAVNLPSGSQNRAYGDTALSTCGAGGATACQALTYTGSGGLGDATADASYIFSENATLLVNPGAGFPNPMACTTGTNPAADTHTCVALAASPISVTTTGTYTPAITVDDVQNDFTASGSATATTATEQRNLAVTDALGLAISPTAPLPTAVDLRAYGSGAGCSGGACVPGTWTASGGLGDPTLDGSYSFTENATGLAAPGAGFPNGITCATGTNPDANNHFCSAAVAVDVTTTGVFSPEVTVVDVGNETTPIGSSVALGTTLTVKPALEFTVNLLNIGPLTPVPTDPLLGGVVGRTYADFFALGFPFGFFDAPYFLRTAGTGLGVGPWAVTGGVLPGDVVCGQGLLVADDFLCFSGTGIPQGAPGSFTFEVTFTDAANASTPAGAQSVDNLGHPDHTIVINPALSVTSPSPLNSSFVGDTGYSQMLMSAGGLAGKTWSTPTFPAAVATPCENFALSAGGVVDNTTGVTTAGTCTFTANVDDPGNASTPDSTITGTTGTASLDIPISAATTLVIDNDFLINGLEGFFYSQSFTASNVTGTAVWVPGGSAGTDCPTPAGTIPTGTALGGATGVLDGPSTTAGTFTFGVCVEDDAAGAFNLKNYTVVINDALVGVANAGSDNLSALTFPPPSADIGPTPMGSTPRAVAIHPNGTRAYVTNQNSDDVSVLDTLTGQVVATIGVSTNSLGIAVTPDGTLAYATGFPSNDLVEIDTATNAVTGNITTLTAGGPRGIGITPDGTKAYVALESTDLVSVVDLTAGPPATESTTVSVGDAPRGVDVTPDGAFVLVTNNGDGTVSVIETAGDTVVATVTVGTNPEGVSITPDGTRAYVANAGDDITVINLVNNTDDADTPPQPPLPFTVLTTITSTSTQPQGIDVTPDGLTAYFAKLATNNVDVIDTDPASGTFHTIVDASVAVGTGPESESGVAAIPYPVLHFTLAVDGVVTRRILAQGDDDQPANPDYSDFIRVLGGVAPYTFADGGTLAGDADCTGLSLDAGTGEVSGNPNPGGGNGVKDCDFTVTVTDSATVPQTISGDFRIVITED